MTLRIPCPFCGPRSIEEWFHGEIPITPAHLTDADDRDLDRAYMSDNPAGVVTEAWFHAAGCRRWVRLQRDTTTDRFIVEP